MTQMERSSVWRISLIMYPASLITCLLAVVVAWLQWQVILGRLHFHSCAGLYYTTMRGSLEYPRENSKFLWMHALSTTWFNRHWDVNFMMPSPTSRWMSSVGKLSWSVPMLVAMLQGKHWSLRKQHVWWGSLLFATCKTDSEISNVLMSWDVVVVCQRSCFNVEISLFPIVCQV